MISWVSIWPRIDATYSAEEMSNEDDQLSVANNITNREQALE